MQYLNKRPYRSVFFSAVEFMQAIGLLLVFAGFLSADHFEPWLSFHGESIATAGLLFLTIGVFKKYPNIFFPRNLLVFVLSVGCVVLMQYLLGVPQYFGDVLLAAVYVGIFAFSFLVGYSALIHNDQEFISKIYLCIFLAALASCFVGVIQFFSLQNLWPFQVGNVEGGVAMIKPSGNLAQPNNFAILLVCGAISFIAFSNKISLRNGLQSVVLLFISILAGLSQSRAALLAALVCFFYFATCRYRRPVRGISLAELSYSALFFLSMIAVYASCEQLSKWLLLDGEIPVGFTQLNGRGTMWGQILAGVAERPLLGFGWNQSGFAQQIGAHAVPGTLSVTHAHNVVVDFIAWFGFPIGITASLLIAFYYARLCLSQRTREGILACGVSLPIAVHALVEFSYSFSFFLIVFAICVGIATGAARMATPDEATNRRAAGGHTNEAIGLGTQVRIAPVALSTVFGVWVIACAVVLIDYIRAERVFVEHRMDMSEIYRTSHQAFHSPSMIACSQLGDLLSATGMVIKEDMSKSSLDTMRNAARRFPYRWLSYRYALALAINKDVSGSTQEFDRILAVSGPKYYASIKSNFSTYIEAHPHIKAVAFK